MCLLQASTQPQPAAAGLFFVDLVLNWLAHPCESGAPRGEGVKVPMC